MLTTDLLAYVRQAAVESRGGLAMIRNPRNAEYAAAGRMRARRRPSIYAVARKMGASVERDAGYATLAFPDADRAADYARWLRRRGRIGIAYAGGDTVGVWR